eukprot:TRINITY_DN1130_c0_g1_i1.p1 TRINITY_DN1130_c0_g1~~TRINITY_DN1130_c0_g1_i1.p1  ORF type:complete len:881 (-),score=184.44 TRINITY_DN1130_c0_g1_i1:103-2487(-)
MARVHDEPAGGDTAQDGSQDDEVVEISKPDRAKSPGIDLNSALVAAYKSVSPALPVAAQSPSSLKVTRSTSPSASTTVGVKQASRKRKSPLPDSSGTQTPPEYGSKRHHGAAASSVRTPGTFSQGLEAPAPEPTTPSVRYSDLGGIESALQDIRELIEYPLTHPEIYAHLGVEPPRGILLHGPPGCGKTLLANAIAGELDVTFFSISAPEIVSGMSGESEAKLRALFASAVAQAPCLVFIDEIDAITPKRDTAQREMERRIVAQLLTCLDGLTSEATGGAPVIVIGATNRPDSLDPALRRAGRFDREIGLGIPDQAARARILRVMSKKLRLAGDFDFDSIAKRTSGFVGADLAAVTKEAAVIAVHRIFQDQFNAAAAATARAAAATRVSLVPSVTTSTITIPASAAPTALAAPAAVAGPTVAAAVVAAVAAAADCECCKRNHQPKCDCTCELSRRAAISDRLRAMKDPLSEEMLSTMYITMADFDIAVTRVQPSAKREGFSTIPDVSWSNVGALREVRAELQRCVVWPIAYPELFRRFGITAPAGLLLFGPPGCGKTLIIKAVAHECGANFIGIKGPQLLNKYVGEAERAVRQLFARARSSAPCIIFFDELDALCPRRSGDSDSNGASRVVNQLLTEMDGLESRRDVFVVAATNRPDVIDPAMLRPGRLDTLISVDLPDAAGREDILHTVTDTQHTPLAPAVNLAVVARHPRCDGFSGADLAALVKEASMCAVQEYLAAHGDAALHAAPKEGEALIEQRHFETALQKVPRSVSVQDAELYNGLKLSIHHSHIRQ